MVCNQENWNQSIHAIHKNRDFFLKTILLHIIIYSFIYVYDIFPVLRYFRPKFERYLIIFLFYFRGNNTRDFDTFCITTRALSPGREIIQSCNKSKIISALKIAHDSYYWSKESTSTDPVNHIRYRAKILTRNISTADIRIFIVD